MTGFGGGTASDGKLRIYSFGVHRPSRNNRLMDIRRPSRSLNRRALVIRSSQACSAASVSAQP